MNIKIFKGKNLPRELLLTTRQKVNLRNAFENKMSTDIKLSKALISKIIQSGVFSGSLLSILAGPLMEVAVFLAKHILAPLGITAAASVDDAGIPKKIRGSGTKSLIISNKEMIDVMKIVQVLEDSNILLKGVTKTIKNETKEEKRGFLGMLFDTLGASLLGNMLAGKGIVRVGYGNKRGKGIVRAGYGSKKKFLIPLHPLANFEIQRYYQNKPRFNGFFSRDNLPNKIKNGAYEINLDEYADTGTHWIALFCKNNEIVYFDSFGVEHVPKEIEKFIEHKNIKTNIFRIQSNNSIICGYFCIGSIDFMFAVKTMIDFTGLFSPYDFEKK